ncbi:hypothetical protein ABVK25_011733 [Lepraria finkii]|uniref:LITAF domain-containing protein n=1 Tax=Lepraria finkii TaxID=1340010 RepID=A0ABR4ALE9_9LECA
MSPYMPKGPSKPYIFEKSPTIQEMRQTRKYRKTLRNYEGSLHDGLMIMLEDLEAFPAPVLCSFCETPVITQAKTERTGFQRFCIAWASVVSVGLLAYPVASTNKNVVHECPSCAGALATWSINNFAPTLKVHRLYRNPPSDKKGENGHVAHGVQTSGYSKVHIGDQNYFTFAKED